MSVDELATLHSDLVEALGELHEIVAADEADAGKYRYKYASLATIMGEVRPVLARHGLAVVQMPTSSDGVLSVGTVLVHRSGSSYSSGLLTMRHPVEPQQVGSLISYLRRYQLLALLGLATEDDDAKSAQQAPPAAPQRSTAGSGRTVAPTAPSGEQTRLAMALFGDLGITDRFDRLNVTSAILGRDVDSWNEVSRAEASSVIDELQRRVAVLEPEGMDR